MRGRGLAVGVAAALIVFDPATTAAAPKRLALLVVALAALGVVVARRARLRAAPAGLVLLAGFVAWSALTLLWGNPAGLGDLATWVGALGCAAAALALPRPTARALVRLACALLGGVAGALAALEAAGGAGGLGIHGGHGNPNWLGMVLALALLPSLELTASLWRRRSRGWPAAALAVAAELAGLGLSHARVAMVAVGAAALVGALARRFRGRTVAAVAGLAAALALALTLGVAGREYARTRALDGDVPVGSALAGRVWIWRASGDAALAHLPLGAGLGRFADAYLDAQGARLTTLGVGQAARRFQNATSAHDDYLEVAVDSGLPALTLLALALAAGIVAHAGHGRRRAAWLAGLGTVVVFGVCALADSPLRQPGAVAILALVLAAARPRTQRARSPRPQHRRTLAPAVLAGLMAALLIAPTLASYLAARRLTAAQDELPPRRLALLTRAARLDPRSGEIALALGLTQLDLADPAAAVPTLERSRGLLANVGTDVALGNAHLMLGEPAAAEAAYERALARDPGSFRAHANAIEALSQLGRWDDAARQLALAQALEPGHPRLATLAARLADARRASDR